MIGGIDLYSSVSQLEKPWSYQIAHFIIGSQYLFLLATVDRNNKNILIYHENTH